MVEGSEAGGPEDGGLDLTGIAAVIADPLRFKRMLRIGDDAYALMRVRKRAQELWDVGGMVGTGASVAGSSVVASSLFAYTAGPLAFIGIGTAATPIGWVLAAGLASGGLYYGVTRWVTQTARVDVIPHAINTPLDALAMSLLDLLASLALRLAIIDGRIAPEERATIQRHFVDEWGYDPEYASRACRVLEQGSNEARVKDIARSLAQFHDANPDCNAEAMQNEVLGLLRNVAAADGVLDEREELALDAIVAVFREERALTLAKVGQSLTSIGNQTGTVLSELTGRLGALAARRQLTGKAKET